LAVDSPPNRVAPVRHGRLAVVEEQRRDAEEPDAEPVEGGRDVEPVGVGADVGPAELHAHRLNLS
jgi:hypothetical protein